MVLWCIIAASPPGTSREQGSHRPDGSLEISALMRPGGLLDASMQSARVGTCPSATDNQERPPTRHDPAESGAERTLRGRH